MQKIGILIETKDGEIKKAIYGIITAARGDKHQLYAFLLEGCGADCKASLQAYGVHKIIEITSDQGFLVWNPVSWSNAIIKAMKHFDIDSLLGLTSLLGKELLPRIAAGLDAPLVLDCTALNLAEHTAVKSQYSGRAIATLKTDGAYHIYGIRPNAVEADQAPCEAEVISFRTATETDGLIVKEMKRSSSEGVDLTEADVILSGGRGLENSENFAILFECAKALGAAVGASRVAVDSGWVPYPMQVGQTGKTVSPKVYIACGISGSVQHFAGMKTAGMIIAINKDLEAAIAKKCDYFAVADLFEVIPALTARLKEIAQTENK